MKSNDQENWYNDEAGFDVRIVVLIVLVPGYSLPFTFVVRGQTGAVVSFAN